MAEDNFRASAEGIEHAQTVQRLLSGAYERALRVNSGVRQFHAAKKRAIVDTCVRKGYFTFHDFGCGKGGDLEKYSRAGASSVVGFDVDAPHLIEARVRARWCRIKSDFILQDVRSLTMQKGDVAVFFFSLSVIFRELSEFSNFLTSNSFSAVALSTLDGALVHDMDTQHLRIQRGDTRVVVSLHGSNTCEFVEETLFPSDDLRKALKSAGYVPTEVPFMNLIASGGDLLEKSEKEFCDMNFFGLWELPKSDTSTVRPREELEVQTCRIAESDEGPDPRRRRITRVSGNVNT